VLNDDITVIASEARQSSGTEDWIAALRSQ
jgi:hypothetical protein